MGFVVWRELARGRKTVEDQGVPWMKMRVWVGWMGGAGARSAYLIVQFAWWKVEGRLAGWALGRVIVLVALGVGGDPNRVETAVVSFLESWM